MTMPPEETLRRWIREHKVCWELLPFSELSHQRLAQVGLELNLYAQHPRGVKANPGCEECRHVHEKLRAIATLVLPKEPRPTRYDIAPFDASFHSRPESEWAWEVLLRLRLMHGEHYLNPLDECQARCAKEIQSGLRTLGAQHKAWLERRSWAESRGDGRGDRVSGHRAREAGSA